MQTIKASFVLFSLMFILSACGVGATDECDNPHPAKKAECDAKGSTEWDKMTWDDGSWG